MTVHDPNPGRPRVGLYVTCLVPLWRPALATQAVRLLEDAGCCVIVPARQTCCGQPAYNAGDRVDAQALAREVIATFEAFDAVILPSGSCAGMLRVHYPRLLADDAQWSARAEALAGRSYEIMSYLHDVLAAAPAASCSPCHATYHDSCSGLRELGIRTQPRALLARVQGLALTELEDGEVCCGFGGLFCVKYPEISARLADDKIRSAVATGADTLLGGDLGCLLALAGRARRTGSRLRFRHALEALAGDLRGPAIGEL